MSETARKIIVADDHPLFREALSLALNTALDGAEIVQTGDMAGLEQSAQTHANADLVLLDLHMPGVQGFSALIYLRAHHPELPVCVISANNNPVVILSRTAPEFLERLFEMEVPEVFDGLITIKKIVRVPGERAKVAVESYDDRIDPVGACVGMKGSRIHSIVRELKNENIDVINYTANDQLLIQRSLSPAKITSIKIDGQKAEVFLKPDQVSLAIGKGGHNIKLAGKLTGFEIDVYRDSEGEDEDVDLEEFADEIDGWIIDELKKVGLDSARAVLDLAPEELVKRSDLEEETVKEIMKILSEELD